MNNFFVVLALITFSLRSSGQVLQILHTNDLHSYWEHNMPREFGGYARIKTLMDRLEEEGNAKGWVTLRLDAGDFSDGNINYLSARGVYSFQLMKLLGYSAIALGNHDYVTGVDPLIERAADSSTSLPLVAANFNSTKNTNVLPGRVIYKGGLKIAVGGATTDEILYRWMAMPATIDPPYPALDDWLAGQNADIRIGLTHIGVADDVQLVRSSRSVDLIVGGHSHETLIKPRLALNRDNHVIPIVQAGFHGRYVGQTVIKLPVWGTANIIHYELHPVTPDLPEDPVIKAKVNQGLSGLNRESKARELYMPVAHSGGVLYVYRYQNSNLGNFIADALKESAHTECALDIGSLYGPGLPKGDLTVREIYNLQPHTYDIDGAGWNVFTTQVSGDQLKKLVGLASWSGAAFLVSGITAELNSFHRIKWMKINGVPVDEKKIYSVAFSEGTLRAASHLSRFRKYLPPPYFDTGVLVREMLLEKVRKTRIFTGNEIGEIRVVWPGSDKLMGGSICGECISGQISK